MFRSLRHAWVKWSFPVAVWLSAGMYFIVAGGIPLPIPANSAKDRTVAFPCMDGACGCRNAEQCWTSCCCHTPAERLAWARQHGVAPPRALIVEVGAMAVAPSRAACCAETKRANCCSSKRSCCSSKSGPLAASPVNDVRHADGKDSIVGIRALACRGFGTNWLAGFVALPPVLLTAECRLMPIELVALMTISIDTADDPPPVPPPRAAFC